MNSFLRLFYLSAILFLFASAPFMAHAGLADIFVEIYDGINSGAVQPTYQTLKEYVVEKKVLEFLEQFDFSDDELKNKYVAFIKSNEFDETYFPFFMSIMDQAGLLSKILKQPGAKDSKNASVASVLKDPQKKEYLRIMLIVFGKLFLYKNGEEITAKALHEQMLKLVQNPNVPKAVTTRLEKILQDPEKAMDLYVFVGTLVKSVGSDYLNDFLERDKLRKAKLQWLEKAGLEKVTQYFKESLTKRRAVMILVDGVGGQYLENVLKGSDSYPTLQKLHDESSWVKQSVSSSPTISTRNIAILETGVTVSDPEFKGESASTGIPNFTYVDRKKQEWMYFWGRDGIRLRELVKTSGGRTIFEHLDVYQTVSFLAQFDTASDDRFSYFAGEVMMQVKPDLAEAIGLANLKARSQKEERLNYLRAKLARYLKRSKERWANQLLWTERHYYDMAKEILQTEDEGLPDFLLWYNPWVDHKTHEFGTHSKEVLGKYLPKFDQDVGVILSFYQTAGAFDNTLFGMVSDHGQINVELPKGSVNVEDLVIHELTSNWKKISSDEGGPPKIDRIKSSILGYDVVFGSTAGGSFVMDLFHQDAYNDDGSLKDAKRWADHPRYQEIRSYKLTNGQTVDWISKIKQALKEYLDYALVREELPKDDPSIDQVVRIISPKGEARVLRKFVPSVWEKLSVDPKFRSTQEFKQQKFTHYLYKYEVIADSLTGEVEGDPLKLSEQSDLLRQWIANDEWHSDREWLEAMSVTDRPDGIHEISHIYDTELAGTINLFPSRGKGFNTGVPGRHAGELFEEKNALQLYFGSGVKKSVIPVARSGSMPVTMIHYLYGDERFNQAKYDFDFESLLGDVLK